MPRRFSVASRQASVALVAASWRARDDPVRMRRRQAKRAALSERGGQLVEDHTQTQERQSTQQTRRKNKSVCALRVANFGRETFLLFEALDKNKTRRFCLQRRKRQAVCLFVGQNDNVVAATKLATKTVRKFGRRDKLVAAAANRHTNTRTQTHIQLQNSQEKLPKWEKAPTCNRKSCG